MPAATKIIGLCTGVLIRMAAFGQTVTTPCWPARDAQSGDPDTHIATDPMVIREGCITTAGAAYFDVVLSDHQLGTGAQISLLCLKSGQNAATGVRHTHARGLS
ncbi:MAG: hypothetical protein R8G34_17065 [Paracoccaceae bacterium]|nr:hypothetical protein [Paracoccaceae bacterium]